MLYVLLPFAECGACFLSVDIVSILFHSFAEIYLARTMSITRPVIAMSLGRERDFVLKPDKLDMLEIKVNVEKDSLERPDRCPYPISSNTPSFSNSNNPQCSQITQKPKLKTKCK